MRQIKFRAWDGKRKAMYKPDSFVFSADGDVTAVWRKEYDGTTVGGLDPEKGRMTLMQYTGQKDNNGREIYEDDIVRVVGVTQPGMKWVVTWANASWELHHVLGGKYMTPMRLATMSVPIEVNGNVHETPELMEVRDEREY